MVVNNDNNIFDESYQKYLEKVEETQKQEINSRRFIEVLKLNQKYSSREYKSAEMELLKYIGNYNDTNDIFESNFEKKNKQVKKLKKIKKIINSLDSHEIESNIFLSTADYFLKSSKRDSKHIIQEVINDYNNLEGVSEKKVSIDYAISLDTLDKIKTSIPLQISTPYYDPKKHKYDYINIVDDKHMEYYRIYNQIVNVLKKICNDIYICRLWKYIPDELIDNISLKSFDINVGIKEENEFNIKFYVNKKKVKKKK